MQAAHTAPFCRAPDGGRFVVDITVPFLRKFGGMLVPSVALVAAIVEPDRPRLVAALGQPGSRRHTPGRDAGQIAFLAGLLGATPWPAGKGADAERAEREAAAKIVALLSPDDIATSLPHFIRD